jgi:hypothetical protein
MLIINRGVHDMSSEVVRVSDESEVVAVRFWGGRERGCVVQMEVSEVEFASWRNEPVMEAASGRVVSFGDWVDAQVAAGHSVVWDSAARQNQRAREFEAHRWADEMPCFREMAAVARQRARVVARDAMRVAR